MASPEANIFAPSKGAVVLFKELKKMKVRIHNFMGHPVQIATEEPGRIIEIQPEPAPFKISNIERIRSIVEIDTGDGRQEATHIAIMRNKVSLQSTNGFPGPREGVLYLVPQAVVEAVRKTNRSTTRDLIVPKQQIGIGPYQLSYANIITELNLDDEGTRNAAYKTWQNSARSVEGYKYPHEFYESDR